MERFVSLDLSKLKESEDEYDNLNLIKKAMLLETEVIVWRPIGENKKYIFNARVVALDEEKRTFVLKIIDANDVIVEKNTPFFFHCQNMTYLFEQDIKSVKNNKLLLSIPSKMHIYNNRQFPRFKISEKRSNTAVVRLKGDDYRAGSNRSLKILDISQSGMGLHVKSNHFSKLKYCSDINVLTICDIELSTSLLTEVMYLDPIENLDGGEFAPRNYRMGLKWKKGLDSEFIKLVMEISESI